MKKIFGILFLVLLFIPQIVYAEKKFHTDILNTSGLEKGSVTIKKQIPRKTFDKLEADDKTAEFVFRLTGTDIFGNEVSREESVSYDSVDKTKPEIYGQDYVTLSVSFDNVEYGQYSISEVNTKELTISKTFPQNDSETFILDKTTVTDGITLSNNQKSAEVTIDKDNFKSDFTVTYKNIPCRGEVKIVKEDGKGNPLQGVQFKLIKENSQTPIIKETDAEGKVTFSDLIFGKYQLIETKTADGQMLLKDPVTVTIPYTASEQEVTEGQLDKNKAVFSERENKWLFSEFGYSITNTAVLDLPKTGKQVLFSGVLMGSALCVLGIYLFTRKKEVRS